MSDEVTKEELIELAEALIFYIDNGDEMEITARHIAGLDSGGTMMLKGSFLEMLDKARAALRKAKGE